jgi:uncharacterized protein involved in tolerance to divalent cations
VCPSSYDLPEIIALPIVVGLPEFLSWIAREMGSEVAGSAS